MDGFAFEVYMRPRLKFYCYDRRRSRHIDLTKISGLFFNLYLSPNNRRYVCLQINTFSCHMICLGGNFFEWRNACPRREHGDLSVSTL